MKRFFLLLLAAIIGLLPLMSACAEAPLDGYPGIDELPAIDTINNPSTSATSSASCPLRCWKVK